MTPSITRMLAWVSTGMLCLWILWGCGGESDNGGGNNLPPATMVAIDGLVHTGNAASPVANATCRFVERNGTQRAQATADGSGRFRLLTLPGQQGFLRCAPPGLTQLILSTFFSTVGSTGGTILPPTGREEVSPRTTVIASLIAQENPADPQTRKVQLLAAAAAQDPDLSMLLDAAEILYAQLLADDINVAFDASNEAGGDGGDGGAGDDGGATGDVGDGAELSPIPAALCTFAQDVEGEVFVTTVLHDLFTQGRITRPDLEGIADAVNQALAGRTGAIPDAFASLFPTGVGRPLTVIADGAETATPGHYFLPVPPGIPGFVRCSPPNQANLVLVQWVRPRAEREMLTAQDVNPLATLSSLLIAARDEAPVSELIALQQNFRADVAGLRVGVTLDNGNLSGFEPINAAAVRAPRVGLAVFAATALYNVFFFEEINATFLDALRNLIDQGEVDPARLAEDPVLSTAQAATIATLVNTSTTQAGEVFDTELPVALGTARLALRVRSRNNTPLSGATVTIDNASESLQCENCPATTAADGTVTLTLVGVPRTTTTPVSVRVTRQDFVTARVTVDLIALTTVERTIELAARDNTGTIGGTSGR